MTPDIPKEEAPASVEGQDDEEAETRAPPPRGTESLDGGTESLGGGTESLGGGGGGGDDDKSPPLLFRCCPLRHSPEAEATKGFRLRRCLVGAVSRAARAASAASSPERPAAPSVCPSAAFEERRETATEEEEEAPSLLSSCSRSGTSSADRSAPSSSGSPRAVPVPWRETAATKAATDGELEEEEGEIALSSASLLAPLTTAVCAGPEGAVSAEERPSWPTALPARIARGEERR